MSPLPPAFTPTTEDVDSILHALLCETSRIPSRHPVAKALETLASAPLSEPVGALIDDLKRSLEMAPEDPASDAALAEILWEVAHSERGTREVTLEEVDAAARVILAQTPALERARKLAGIQKRGLRVLESIVGPMEELAPAPAPERQVTSMTSAATLSLSCRNCLSPASFSTGYRDDGGAVDGHATAAVMSATSQ